MPITLQGALSPKMQAYYDKKLLLTIKNNNAYYQLGQKRSLPKGNNDTVIFTRMKPLPKRTDPLTETINLGIAPADYKGFESTEMSVPVKRYGDIAATSHWCELLSWDSVLDERVGILGQQAADSIEELVKREVGIGLIRERADGDPAYQKDSITTADGSTNTLTDSALTEATDYWNGAFITFTDPMDDNYGKTVQVSAFASNTATFTPSLEKPVLAGSEYRIVSSTGVVATDTLSIKTLNRALRTLKNLKASPMSDGKYVCIINPNVEYDIMKSPEWLDFAKYRQDMKNIYNGEIGTWMNVRFVSASEIYRETVAGVYNERGDVHIATLLGGNAYGVVELEGKGKKVKVKTPDQLGQPLESFSTIAWDIVFATKVLNATFGVNIVCGAEK